MRKENKPQKLSLATCKKLLPVANGGKYVGFLGMLFFQAENTRWLFYLFLLIMLASLTADTYLKLSQWKCPCCGKPLPYDFYSRKTMTACPNCTHPLELGNHKT